MSRSREYRIVVLAATVAWIIGVAAAVENTNRSPSSAAGSKAAHWSLRPIQRPEPPKLPSGNKATRNPIDAFILDKLAQNHLAPSPEAERRVLIRRLYFDLVGLPPTMAEAESFERDAVPEAYERLVDRLLASPRYGERWAQHWLDAVRFAETHGFEMNNPRPNAWPYRDYVIRAFNDDKPYDRFMLEQLAGDLLGEDAATGFLVAGPWDQVKSPDPVLTATQRADELHDMVSTTGSAFLGLTVGCARCHDHKFDPIPQQDYYALKACLAGVQHGERKLHTAESLEREREANQARQRLAELETELIAFEPLAKVGTLATNSVRRASVNARRNIERFAGVTARRLRFSILRTTDAEPCLDELEVYTAGPNATNVALASLGCRARASSVFPNSEIHRLEHLNDGKVGNGHSWISNERGRGWVELEFPGPVRIDHIVWGRDREQVYKDRLAIEYQVAVAMATNDWQTVASSADRLAYEPKAQSDPSVQLSESDAATVSKAKELRAEATKLEARLKELMSEAMVYAGVFTADPPSTYRLNRGDPMQAREAVEPGALGAIPVRFALVATNATVAVAAGERPVRVPDSMTAEQRRRLALGQWLADPANPLPARVLVNRLWLHHFGEGLVSTPSDFGVHGARPTHPELLDWLAAELIHPSCADGSAGVLRPWSVKHLQRLMVTSAAYRQSSAGRADGLAGDASTRLLWRFPPRRLEAEALRDALLVAAGQLDCRAGGPGFSAFEPNDNYVRVYNPKQKFGPGDWRRMIYMTKVRMQQDGTFGAFDCPDGGQIAPKRMRSITPLQALNLLNSGFMLQVADQLAARLEREAGSDPGAQAGLAFELLFNRHPEPEELNAANQLATQHGLPVLCRALFNSNEFVFLE